MVFPGNLFREITGKVFDRHRGCLLLVWFFGGRHYLSRTRNAFIAHTVEWSSSRIDQLDIELDEFGRKFLRRVFRNNIDPAPGDHNLERDVFASLSWLRHDVLLEDRGQE